MDSFVPFSLQYSFYFVKMDKMMLRISALVLLAGLMVASAEECKDLSSICHQLTRYCHKKDYGTWMHDYCPLSCGFCTAPVTERPPPPAPKVRSPSPPIVPGFCGKPRVKGVRVVGGKNATRGSWPWQILMLFNGYAMCGGALISPHWVVTAAHCVYGDETYPELFTIRVGEHDRRSIEGSETEYDVEKVIPHPEYDPSKLNNDIALMKLKMPVLMGKYVEPVCLPDEPPKEGDNCYITGWGKMVAGGRMADILQQGKLPVVSKKTCQALNTPNIQIPVTDAMICAGSGGSSNLSGCHGDSGGPFVCEKKGKWFLQGAVSHGSSHCNSTETYTVFSKVTYFRDWIDEMMTN